MEVLQIIVVVAVCLQQSQYGNCLDFTSRFNELTAFASKNGGYDNPEASRMLIELKTDMMRACREGTLMEVTGFLGISQVGGTATKAYYFPNTGPENQVLPDVDCRPIESKAAAYHDDLSRARVIPLSEQRTFPELHPDFQSQRTEQIQPPWWLQLASRFDSIEIDTVKNDGYLTPEGTLALEHLKLDIMSACKTGEIRVVGPGKDIKGLFNDVTIPTKVYVLTSLPYSEEKTLPEVDCSTTSRFVANVDNGKKISLEERLKPIPSSPYRRRRSLTDVPITSSTDDTPPPPPPPRAPLARSTSLTGENLRNSGLFEDDDDEPELP